MTENILGITALKKAFTEIPFNRMLGLHLDEIKRDSASMSFEMKKELIGNYMHGILHGGVISSVLDMAGGVVAMAAAIYKKKEQTLETLAITLGKSSTISLHIDYIRPGKGERFTAKAWLQHSGNKISFTRMELFSEEEVLIATGTATYLTG